MLSKLLEHGLCVIPVHGKTKRPKHNAWQKRTAADNDPKEFGPGDNVGVVLGDASGGIVDIDIDNPAALLLARYLLPKTGMSFGRETKPQSHLIYRIEGDCGASMKFQSKQHGTIIEYRAGGAQTIFPPSIHPSGEQVMFDSVGLPATSCRRLLIVGIGLIAIDTEVLPHYREGMRNDIIISLCGMLHAAGLPNEDIATSLIALVKASHDPDIDERKRAFQRTITRGEHGEPNMQRRRLAELIGDVPVAGIEKHLQDLGYGAAFKALRPRTTALLTQPRSGDIIVTATEDDFTDVAIAREFAKTVCEGQLRYVPEHDQFYVYGSGIWSPDLKSLGATALFNAFIDEQASSLRVKDRFIAQKLRRFQSASGVKAALEMLKTEIRTPQHLLNNDDLLLCCANNVLDLGTREIKEHSPDYLFTAKIDVEYDPSARCPRFLDFMRQTSNEDQELNDYMKAILGSCLTGKVDRQEYYVFYGEKGANGKSVLANLMLKVMGSYGGSIMTSTLFSGKSDGKNADLASMVGKRLGVAQEAESTGKLDAPLLKGITGGDPIKVRRLYGHPFDMVAKFKLFVLCNSEPMLNVNDSALKRRTVVIPFEAVVPPNKRDPNLIDKLWSERSGILNWLLDGSQAYLSGKVEVPARVLRATENLYNSQDTIRSFLLEYTVPDPSGTVPVGLLHGLYEQWCNQEYIQVYNSREFTARMRKLGFQQDRRATERYWKGLRLITEADKVRKPARLPLDEDD